ncbi:DUF2905 domain-containing protein [Tissierella sp. Yu-01]|uniref:DUF2905 domain-containing protein n=1 Tax=Tissierella sp. Yu-01 TaxID=3035694 RepID=UPI00240D10D8|nr:DUF2905 domain-containing protein [Tissierella sp. Yu-01]WFA09855.1 DUF2905 domain-containing protein [Tissierella sp. Yu-01]
MDSLGKLIITIGLILIIIGLFITLGGKFGIGKLPGDIYIDKGNFKFYFPITTSIIISIVLSLILKFFRK